MGKRIHATPDPPDALHGRRPRFGQRIPFVVPESYEENQGVKRRKNKPFRSPQEDEDELQDVQRSHSNPHPTGGYRGSSGEDKRTTIPSIQTTWWGGVMRDVFSILGMDRRMDHKNAIESHMGAWSVIAQEEPSFQRIAQFGEGVKEEKEVGRKKTVRCWYKESYILLLLTSTFTPLSHFFFLPLFLYVCERGVKEESNFKTGNPFVWWFRW